METKIERNAQREMLELLKQTVASLEYWFNRYGDPEGANSTMMNRARATIARANMFKTTISGVGPYCIEFEDGEIIHTRSEQRQHLLAAAPDMLEALKAALSAHGQTVGQAWDDVPLEDWEVKANAAIAKVKGETNETN